MNLGSKLELAAALYVSRIRDGEPYRGNPEAPRAHHAQHAKAAIAEAEAFAEEWDQHLGGHGRPRKGGRRG